MNGIVKIGDFTVTRAGKKTTVTSHRRFNREDFKRLKEQADARLASAGRDPLPDLTAKVRRDEVLRRVDEALARARRYKPRPIPTPVPRSGWRDLADSDPWGRPPRNQLTAKCWAGGNCLRAAIGSILGCDIAKVPDPSIEFREPEGWLDRYDQRLQKETGFRLERLPASLCPPRDANQLWICGIHMPNDDADHVVVARGHYVVHDSLGEFTGLLPTNRILDGMILRPTQRVIPALSPLGSGYSVVAA